MLAIYSGFGKALCSPERIVWKPDPAVATVWLSAERQPGDGDGLPELRAHSPCVLRPSRPGLQAHCDQGTAEPSCTTWQLDQCPRPHTRPCLPQYNWYPKRVREEVGVPADSQRPAAEARTGPVVALHTSAAWCPLRGLAAPRKPCGPSATGASSVVGQAIGHSLPAKDRAVSGPRLEMHAWPP